MSSVGGSDSTWTVRQPGAEPLPTLSATVPQTLCEPLAVIVWVAGIVAGSMPLPGLPSDRAGSTKLLNETLTLFAYQPPLPA